MFKIGQLVATSGVFREAGTDPVFSQNVRTAFSRYMRKDWGDLTQGDKEMNDQALQKDERILASYWILNSQSEKKKIFIITEWDRSATTILFADEY